MDTKEDGVAAPVGGQIFSEVLPYLEVNQGNQDEVDKLNQTRNRINKEIRELKEQLPTAEVQKQVVAINR